MHVEEIEGEQQEARGEFIGGIERVQVQTECLGNSEMKGERVSSSLKFLSAKGFLLRIVVWCMCPLRQPGTSWMRITRCYSLELGCLGVSV